MKSFDTKGFALVVLLYILTCESTFNKRGQLQPGNIKSGAINVARINCSWRRMEGDNVCFILQLPKISQCATEQLCTGCRLIIITALGLEHLGRQVPDK